MMFRYSLLFIVTAAFPAPTRAGESIFTEFEEVYLAVFADTVHDHKDADRVLSVAMAVKDDVGFVPMPESLWKRLKLILAEKQVDVSRFVPADRIVWVKSDSKFVDKVSGKDAWIYYIDGITWHGADRLYVSESMSHGNLAGGGSTLVLSKKDGRWTIVDRTEEWISETQGGSKRKAVGATAGSRQYTSLTRVNPQEHPAARETAGAAVLRVAATSPAEQQSP